MTATMPAIMLRFMLALVALLAPGCASKSRPLERHEYSRAAMGTEARVVLYAPGEEEARKAAEAAFARIAELERVMSDWHDDSELMELCRGAGGPARPVSGDLFSVLERACSIAEASDGAIDPTVGPLVRLWRQARKDGVLPDPAALAEARSRVGWSLIELNGGIRTVTLSKKAMLLDLGGIGKGFACDAALRTLADLGFPSALVALSGDVACGDPPPDRPGWSVKVGKTGEEQVLANAAISTSGDTEQFAVIGGVRYSHVVDPRTGIALTDSPWVTITARDGATADALATAASVLGEEKGRALVRRFTGAKVVLFGK